MSGSDSGLAYYCFDTEKIEIVDFILENFLSKHIEAQRQILEFNMPFKHLRSRHAKTLRKKLNIPLVEYYKQMGEASRQTREALKRFTEMSLARFNEARAMKEEAFIHPEVIKAEAVRRRLEAQLAKRQRLAQQEEDEMRAAAAAEAEAEAEGEASTSNSSQYEPKRKLPKRNASSQKFVESWSKEEEKDESSDEDDEDDEDDDDEDEDDDDDEEQEEEQRGMDEDEQLDDDGQIGEDDDEDYYWDEDEYEGEDDDYEQEGEEEMEGEGDEEREGEDDGDEEEEEEEEDSSDDEYLESDDEDLKLTGDEEESDYDENQREVHMETEDEDDEEDYPLLIDLEGDDEDDENVIYVDDDEDMEEEDSDDDGSVHYVCSDNEDDSIEEDEDEESDDCINIENEIDFINIADDDSDIEILEVLPPRRQQEECNVMDLVKDQKGSILQYIQRSKQELCELEREIETKKLDQVFIVPVKWNFKPLQYFRFKRFQSFRELFERFAEQEDVPLSCVCFETENGRPVYLRSTPDNLPLLPTDVLEGCLLRGGTCNYGEYPVDCDDDRIEVKIQFENKKLNFSLRINPTSPLIFMVAEVAETLKQPRHVLKFFIDGERLDTKLTGDELELTGGEVFDVQIN